MNFEDAKKIEKPKENNRVERPTQTGFSSPATHYNEPRIDLNKVLITNSDATFYVRVKDDSYLEHGIEEKDVLIIDKSLNPKKNQLTIVIQNGSFEIVKIGVQEYEELDVWGVITYIIKSVL